MTVLRPADGLGPVLTGRSEAALLRARIVDGIHESGKVVVDLTGVQTMSPSFADELFAKVPRELVDSGAVTFENLPAQLDPLVRFVMSGRGRGGARV